MKKELLNLGRLLETNCYFFNDFCYQLKNFDISEIGGNLCTDKNNYKVIDVLKVKNIFYANCNSKLKQN